MQPKNTLFLAILFSFFTLYLPDFTSGLTAQTTTGLYGCKFYDQNCNGIWDPHEPAIGGWPIIITDASGNVVITTTTNDEGCWSAQVPVSSIGATYYEVSEGSFPGWTNSYPPNGVYGLQVTPNQAVDGLDFGNCFDGFSLTLAGCKYHDLNCNGIIDPNEPAIPGWSIFVEDQTNGLTYNLFTDASGCYEVTVPAVSPGVGLITYVVSEHLPSGWTQTAPAIGYYTVQQDGGVIDDLHFLNCDSDPPATTALSGCKFNDLDCNGIWDANEPALPNWPVYIANTATGMVDTVYTNADGCWSVEVPAPATYEVSEGTLSPYWQQTYPPSGSYLLNVAQNQPIDHLDFGNGESRTIIASCKVNDLNCNGQIDPNEPAIPGWPLVLHAYDPHTNLETTDTFFTEESGCYTFNLAPGAIYTITEVVLPGWTSTGITEIGPIDLTQAACGTTIIDVLPFLNCQEPADSCGAIVDDVLEFDCDDDGFHYTYTFYLQNNSSDNITSFLLSDFPGMPDYFSNNNYPGMFPIPPGGVAGPFSTTVTVPFPILQGNTGCFTVTLITDGEVCCHFEHCIEVPGIVPCDSVYAEVMPIAPPGNNTGAIDDDCCYEVNLINDFCPNFFSGVRLEIQTPGVTFSNYTTGSSLWAVSSPSPALLVADYLGGINGNGFLPIGPSGPFFFCINVDEYGGGPVDILISWLALNPATGEIIGICEELITVECTPPCAIVSGLEEVLCLDNGNFLVPNLCVYNNSSETPTTVLLEVQSPAGVVIFPDQFDYTGDPSCTPLEIGGVSEGDVVVIKVLLLDEASGWCCHVFIEIQIPDCNNLCIDPSIIDPSIICPTVYEPVCGCDGVTYLNECVAQNYYGVTNWTPGPCPDVCIEEGLINTGMACTTQYEPVCGCDGMTYTNACVALYYYGVTQWTPGPCLLIPNPGPPIGNPSGYAENVQYLHGYPNPVSQRLYVALPFGKYQIETFNTRGQTIAAQTLSVAEGDETPSVETGNLPDGVYMLHATDENGKRYLLRFVKTGN